MHLLVDEYHQHVDLKGGEGGKSVKRGGRGAITGQACYTCASAQEDVCMTLQNQWCMCRAPRVRH